MIRKSELRSDHIYTFKRGKLYLNFHSGQRDVWNSDKRFIAMIAGTQGGKTSFGPIWLYREMQRMGHGDYMVVTPTFGLLEKKALPEFQSLFEDTLKLGEYMKIRKVFNVSEAGERKLFGKTHKEAGQPPTRIMFGYAGNPDSLESATAKAVWCDEAGQSMFKLQSWEALQRRLSIHEGRALITTTPYNLGWLKQVIYDPWIKANKQHPYIDVVRFRSVLNPSFPEAEYQRAKETLPSWKFKMFYDAVFARPEGMIYNMFNEAKCKVSRFDVPRNWATYVGLDFGGVNTVALFYALDPDTKKLYLFKTYQKGNIPVRKHVQNIESILEGRNFIMACGGNKSEIQWREEFSTAGLHVRVPKVTDVEVQIDKVIEMHSTDRIYVFDDLDVYLEEKSTYRRELDDQYNPTEKIENKSAFHHMDAERYIISSISTASYGQSEMADLVNANERESDFW